MLQAKKHNPHKITTRLKYKHMQHLSIKSRTNAEETETRNIKHTSHHTRCLQCHNTRSVNN